MFVTAQKAKNMEAKLSKLPVKCPSCGSGLSVQSLACSGCDTVVTGRYDLPVLLMLDKEELEFILRFVMNSGSLKEMSNEMGLSYPTIRNYLDDLIDKLQTLDYHES
jgi:hypothetical protein